MATSEGRSPTLRYRQRVHIGLLGELEVVDDEGRVVTVVGAKLRSLLAILAVHAGRVVPAEQLIDALWGDSPPAAVRNGLQGLVSKLRRALDSKGTLVIVGGDGGGRWTGGFFRGVLRAPLVSMFVGQRLHGLSVKENQQTLLALSKLIEAGDVTPVIDRTFPLIEAADAIRYLEQGHPAGKVVVTVTA